MPPEPPPQSGDAHDIAPPRPGALATRVGEHFDDVIATTVQRSSDFAIMAMDIDGAITAWNSGAEAIFGYTRDEIAGLTAHDLFVPEDVAAGVPEQEMATARAEGRAEDNRWHLRKDGRRIFCSGVTTPVDVEGMRGYVKIARDVTRQRTTDQHRERQLEQERISRTNAEAAVALKDEFLAVMSHELKHPLNLINVNAEILARTVGAQLARTPHAARALETLKHAVRTQSRIIDDLLDLSRVRTGKLALDTAAVDLVAVAQTAVETASADLSTQHLDIVLEAMQPTVLVDADVARLDQILWNLLGNANKFTPRGGRVTVRTSVDGEFGRLDVIDTGQGIEPALLPQVFEMFGQVHVRAASAQSGLGIGLALVKQLAEHHGGRIEGASDGPGRGSRFSVWIPLYTRRLGLLPEAAAADAPARFHGLRILLVDDDPVTVASLRVLMELEGASVATATTGAAALGELDRAEVDVVLTDVGMPDMDGYQLLAAIRARPDGSSLPVIALTGFGRRVDMEPVGSPGFTGHIAKPVSLDALGRLLTTARKGVAPARQD